MINRTRSAAIFAVSAVVFAASVTAANTDVIATRQAGFKQIGKANKAISDELKAGQPSVQVLQQNAKILAARSLRLPGWFPKGSGPEAGVKTGASPAIWQQAPGFRAQAVNFAKASRALNVAAGSGDITRMRVAFAAVGGTCKGCHDTYRVRD